MIEDNIVMQSDEWAQAIGGLQVFVWADGPVGIARGLDPMGRNYELIGHEGVYQEATVVAGGDNPDLVLQKLCGHVKDYLARVKAERAILIRRLPELSQCEVDKLWRGRVRMTAV